jgi:hypothetical protein
MVALNGHFAVRVTVTEAWDQVTLAAGPDTSVGELKRRGLSEALGGRTVDPDAYVVKLRGAEVFDEAATLGALGVPANAALIILPRRRRPVR